MDKNVKVSDSPAEMMDENVEATERNANATDSPVKVAILTIKMTNRIIKNQQLEPQLLNKTKR